MQTYSGRMGIFLATCLVLSLFLSGLLSRARADTLIFGKAWVLPDEVSYSENPTPWAAYSSLPPDPNEDPPPPDATGMDIVKVPQFDPQWGILNSVNLEIDGSLLYTAGVLGPPISEVGGGIFFVRNNLWAQVSIAGPGFSATTGDQASPDNGFQFLIGGFGFDGQVAQAPFIGTGTVNYIADYELRIDFGVDENGDAFITPDDADLWQTSIVGGYIGTVVVTYDFTPAGSSTGGPPNGTLPCQSCGPLPGDADMDGFVGLGDMNTVLGNWNQSIVGWNNGDFDGDGFVGIADLNVVLGNWNAATPPLVAAEASVPEPALSVLFGAAGAFSVIRRRCGRV